MGFGVWGLGFRGFWGFRGFRVYSRGLGFRADSAKVRGGDFWQFWFLGVSIGMFPTLSRRGNMPRFRGLGTGGSEFRDEGFESRVEGVLMLSFGLKSFVFRVS